MIFLLDELKKENRKQKTDFYFFGVDKKTSADVVSITAVIAALVADDA